MPYPYRVLLLRPKVLAKDHGREVAYLKVEEDSPDEAVVAAQQIASEENEHPECEPGDWHPLLVIEGYEDNIVPAPEPDRWFRPDLDEATYLSQLLTKVARDSPSAARSALASRLLKKIRNAPTAQDSVEIRLTGIEHRVLEHVLYRITSDEFGGKEPEMVRRLCIRLIAMPPTTIDDDLG